MQSKNKPSPTAAERAHIVRVKLLPCSVCDEGGGEGAPSDAHEIEQGMWWLAVALCHSCHQGALLGWHGQKRMWLIKKMEMLDALSVTIRRLMVENEQFKGGACLEQKTQNPMSKSSTRRQATPAT